MSTKHMRNIINLLESADSSAQLPTVTEIQENQNVTAKQVVNMFNSLSEDAKKEYIEDGWNNDRMYMMPSWWGSVFPDAPYPAEFARYLVNSSNHESVTDIAHIYYDGVKYEPEAVEILKKDALSSSAKARHACIRFAIDEFDPLADLLAKNDPKFWNELLSAAQLSPDELEKVNAAIEHGSS